MFFVGCQYRKEARRVNDEPLCIFAETILYGYVPRDYLNLEMRHQYVLFIDCFIVLLYLFRWQKYTHYF